MEETSDLCKQSNCIPYIFDDSVEGERPCRNYDTNQCFEPAHDDMNFYRSINWEGLSAIMEREMNNFMIHLNNLFKTDALGFKSLVLSIYPDIIARIHDNELFFKVGDLVSKTKKKCNDNNYSFSIECQKDNEPNSEAIPKTSRSAAKPAQGIRLFHIAVHSEKPKYFNIDNGGVVTRSMHTCGYFPKTAGSTTSSDTGSGAFHYKIDNYGLLDPSKSINGKNCETKIDDTLCPFKKLVPLGTTGRFIENPDVGFENLSFKGNFNIDRQKRFIELHSFIYNEFVKFWNDNIRPKVAIDSTSLDAHQMPSDTRRGGFATSTAAKGIQGVTRERRTRRYANMLKSQQPIMQNRTDFDAAFPRKVSSRARSNPKSRSNAKRNSRSRYRPISNPTGGSASRARRRRRLSKQRKK